MTAIRHPVLFTSLLAASVALLGPAHAEPRPGDCDADETAKALAFVVRSGAMRSAKAVGDTLKLGGGEDSTYERDRSRAHWSAWSWNRSALSCLGAASLRLSHWPAELTPLNSPETRASHTLSYEKWPMDVCLTRTAIERAFSGESPPTDECRSLTPHGAEPGNLQCWQGTSRAGTTWHLRLSLDANTICVQGFSAYWLEMPVTLTREQQRSREEYAIRSAPPAPPHPVPPPPVAPHGFPRGAIPR